MTLIHKNNSNTAQFVVYTIIRANNRGRKNCKSVLERIGGRMYFELDLGKG